MSLYSCAISLSLDVFVSSPVRYFVRYFLFAFGRSSGLYLVRSVCLCLAAAVVISFGRSSVMYLVRFFFI